MGQITREMPLLLAIGTKIPSKQSQWAEGNNHKYSKPKNTSLAGQTLLTKEGERKLYYAVVLRSLIWMHYALTNSYVLWSTVCIPNCTGIL